MEDKKYTSYCTGCPTHYRTRHFFNNSNANEDIATKFEQEYVLFFHISYTMRQVRFKFRCNILISGKIIKEMPNSVASGTPCIILVVFVVVCYVRTFRKKITYVPKALQRL